MSTPSSWRKFIELLLCRPFPPSKKNSVSPSRSATQQASTRTSFFAEARRLNRNNFRFSADGSNATTVPPGATAPSATRAVIPKFAPTSNTTFAPSAASRKAA